LINFQEGQWIKNSHLSCGIHTSRVKYIHSKNHKISSPMPLSLAETSQRCLLSKDWSLLYEEKGFMKLDAQYII
jgi:hypothetical protein